MKIIIAGADKTVELGETLILAADERKALLYSKNRDDAAECIDHQEHILTLRDCVSERDFLKQLFWLMQTAPQTRTGSFDVPGQPGTAGKIIMFLRRCLWRVFRYQHDRMAFQQNTINQQLTSAMRYLEQLHKAEISRAEEKIKDLSGRLAALETSGKGNES